jgi:hypothetical protein
VKAVARRRRTWYSFLQAMVQKILSARPEKGALHKRQLRLGVVILERVLIFEES